MWRQQYVLKRTKGTTNLLPFPILKEALERGLKRGRQGGQAGCWTRARWEGQGWGASWGVWFPSGSVHLHSWAWPNKSRSNRLLQAQGLKARIGKTQNWPFLSGHPAQSLLSSHLPLFPTHSLRPRILTSSATGPTRTWRGHTEAVCKDSSAASPHLALLRHTAPAEPASGITWFRPGELELESPRRRRSGHVCWGHQASATSVTVELPASRGRSRARSHSHWILDGKTYLDLRFGHF